MTHLPRPLGTPVVIKVVRVSGTIKKAEEEVIRRAKDITLRAKLAQGDGKINGPLQGILKAVGKRAEDEVMVDVEDAEDESESESE